MEDAELLRSTHTRLIDLRVRGKTLEQLAAEFVARNHGFYVNNPNETQQLRNLPPMVRDIVLQELCALRNSYPAKRPFRKFNERKKAFEQLLGPKTRAIDLAGILSFCPRPMFRKTGYLVIQAIARHVPNLEELTIGKTGGLDCVNSIFISKSLEGELAKLSNLKNLSNFSFAFFEHVASLCSNLPNLQIISASFGRTLFQETVDEEYLEMCFPSLIVHNLESDFSRLMLYSLEDHLDRICSFNAEALDQIYHSKASNFSFDFFTGSIGKLRRVSSEFYGGHGGYDCDAHRTLKRFHKWDWSCQDEKPISAADASSQWNPLTAYHYNRGIHDFREDLLARFFEIGQELRIIEIKHAFDFLCNIDFNATFELCPKLERLTLTRVGCLANPEAITQFAQLRELHISSGISRCSHRYAINYCSILSAPNLEKVSICGSEMTFVDGDLENVAASVAEGKILQKLDSLVITVCFDSFLNNPPTAHFQDFTGAISNLLKVASAFLPRLTRLRLVGRHDYPFGENYSKYEGTRRPFDVGKTIRDSNSSTGGAWFEESILGLFEHENLVKFLRAYL